MVSVLAAWPPEAPTRLMPTPALPAPEASRRIRLLPAPSQVRALFERTLEASLLPAVVDALPFAHATYAAEANGTLHLHKGGAHLTLREVQGRRFLRGIHRRRGRRVAAELVQVEPDVWAEIYAEIEEFDAVADLDANRIAPRRRAVRVHPDGSRVIRRFEHHFEPARDLERWRRCTRRVYGDGDWAEDEETLIRVGDRARLDSTRRRATPGLEDPRTLCCEYPWLVKSAYARAYDRISKWVAP